jgi:hypothetical protein
MLMIAQLVEYVFTRIGHLWLLDTGFIHPDEDDIAKFLDSAASTLYTSDVGDRLESGGLIIEKAEHGHDVYVFVGTYE